MANERSVLVTGVMSPKPVVLIVVTVQYSDAVYLHVREC